MAISAALGNTDPAASQPLSLTPATMPRIGAVDGRYQSYNVEMLEVTGGRFWRPYGLELEAALRQPALASSGGDTPAGMNPGLYEYRPPIDLTNPRLRKLAAALGPAYVRVSGTWANTTYFPTTDGAPGRTPACQTRRRDAAQTIGVIGLIGWVPVVRRLGFASDLEPGVGDRVPQLEHPILQKHLLAVPRP
jgi:hypothetical protein